MENNGSSLAKISLGINVLLIIAVIILFAKMPGSGTDEVADADDTSSVENHVVPDDGQLRICYFQADSINNLDMMAELEALGAEAQQNAEDKMRGKEREIQRWQENWGDPSKLLPSEQRRYQEEAIQKEQEIAMFQQQVQMELAMEQENLMFKLITRVSEASKKFAEENGYDFVLSYQLGQNVYYGAPNYDVTSELMDLINSEYRENQTPLNEEGVEAGEGDEGAE